MTKKLLPLIAVGALVLIGAVVIGVKPAGQKASKFDTEFPLPSTVESFTKGTQASQINFATKLSVKEAENFYRTELTKQGYTERTINTAATETTFSMVYDGHTSGKQIVVQGVDLGGKTNVNVRLEKVGVN